VQTRGCDVQGNGFVGGQFAGRPFSIPEPVADVRIRLLVREGQVGKIELARSMAAPSVRFTAYRVRIVPRPSQVCKPLQRTLLFPDDGSVWNDEPRTLGTEQGSICNRQSIVNNDPWLGLRGFALAFDGGRISCAAGKPWSHLQKLVHLRNSRACSRLIARGGTSCTDASSVEGTHVVSFFSL